MTLEVTTRFYPDRFPVPTVEPLSYSALDYLKSFGVVAVAVSPSGRVYVCRDPKGAAAAWWTKSEHADQIAHVAWTNADVPGAASRLGLTVTPHETVLRRVGERTAKIDEAVRAAVSDGVLKEFNSRIQAAPTGGEKAGKRFHELFGSAATAACDGRRCRGQRRERNSEIVCRRSVRRPVDRVDFRRNENQPSMRLSQRSANAGILMIETPMGMAGTHQEAVSNLVISELAAVAAGAMAGPCLGHQPARTEERTSGDALLLPISDSGQREISQVIAPARLSSMKWLVAHCCPHLTHVTQEQRK